VLVCELLRANLFEFQRFTRASGEPPYFTPPRVRSIARQVHVHRSGTCCSHDSIVPLCCHPLPWLPLSLHRHEAPTLTDDS
jgi:hypothetical protein